jgi:outer membrane usher protein
MAVATPSWAKDEANADVRLAASALPPVTAAPAVAPAEAMLILDVEVNGVARGLMPFHMIADRLWASPQVLRDLGLRIAAPTAAPAEEPLLLLEQQLGPGVTYSAGAQSLAIMVEVAKLDVGTHRLATNEQDQPVAQSATGVLLNYDLYANYAGSRLAFDGFGELRAFSGNVLLESTGVFNSGAAAGQSNFRRLDTTLSWSLPERRLTMRAGDILTRGTSWSRPTRLGGFRLGTDFALQPYLVTAPIPTFFGEATLPSTVDLYIDGLKRYSGSVAPGPFELGAGGNHISGAGTAQLVVTDALGQVSTLLMPFYDTPQLLRQGLTDWSIELGAVRRDYGIRSFAYAGDPALSASLRRGLSDNLTIEAHGEATAGLANAGAGAAVLLPFGGVLSGSVAASTDRGRQGARAELGYAWTDSTFNLSATVQRASSDFADLPSREGAQVPRSREVLNAGFNSERLGYFGASLIRQRAPGEPREAYASVNWQRSLGGDLAVSLSGNMGLRRGSARGVFLTISYSPGQRDHLSASLQSGRNRSSGSLSYRHSLPLDGGTGWALDGSYDGDRVQAAGQIDHLGQHGQITAGARMAGGRGAGYAGVSGALVAMRGDVFVARKVYEGFAVVDTAGIADVPVLLHNRTIGRTNRKGRLLVSGLNPYQDNRITINAEDLPPELTVASVEREAVPALGAGVAVDFAIARSTSALVTLVDQQGKEIAVGTAASMVDGVDQDLVVGFGGQLYIEHAVAGALVRLADPVSPCSFRLPDDLAAVPAGMIGKVICRRDGE